MAVLESKDGKELIATCDCGCENAVHLKIDSEVEGTYCFMSFMNGNFYRDQEAGAFRSLVRKLKKIICVVRGKDFYYSDVCMTKEDFQQFKEYVNRF